MYIHTYYRIASKEQPGRLFFRGGGLSTESAYFFQTHVQAENDDTVFPRIVALGVYFFNPALQGATIRGRAFIRDGRLFFQPHLRGGVYLIQT